MTPRPSNRQRAYDETVDMHPSLGKKNDVSPNSSNGSYNGTDIYILNNGSSLLCLGHAGHSTVQENRFWTGSPFRKERTMLERTCFIYLSIFFGLIPVQMHGIQQ